MTQQGNQYLQIFLFFTRTARCGWDRPTTMIKYFWCTVSSSSGFNLT